MRFLETRRFPAREVVSQPRLTIYQGKAEDWPTCCSVDLVVTNPYGPLPRSVWATPMIVHQWRHRFDELREWTGYPVLEEIASWNDGREAFWVANMTPVPVDLSAFKPEPGGWYPEALVRRLLGRYGHPERRPFTVWDGFMGRGTVGKVALEMGMNYIGVEELPAHIELALTYLGVEERA